MPGDEDLCDWLSEVRVRTVRVLDRDRMRCKTIREADGSPDFLVDMMIRMVEGDIKRSGLDMSRLDVRI